MLESYLIVLNGVKNDKNLFRKELIKAINWISFPERDKFIKMVRKTFDSIYKDIIKEISENKPLFILKR